MKSNQSSDISKLNDHLANERTFLAWIRTSIGIMVFGFVVEKFSLFLKQVVLFLGKTPTTTTISKSKLFQGYSSFLGIILVSLGVLICVLAFIKYKKIEKQINQDIFEESILLDVMLTLSVLLIGIFLVIYLINSL